MKQLIIFRGPSGSGKSTAKSTFAKALNEKSVATSHEADDYFYLDGEYQFDPKELPRAHATCQKEVRESMEIGNEYVIVSNTSMALWELNPYIQLANEFGYIVKVYRLKGPWDAATFASRNIHGVTQEIIQKQINKYQPLENEEEWQ